MTEPKEVPHSFDHHIILYSKNWYKQSEEIINDLRILLSEYTGVDQEEFTDNDIQCTLVNCFTKYAPQHSMGQWVQEMLGIHHACYLYNRQPEQVMVSALSIADGKYADPEQVLKSLKKED